MSNTRYTISEKRVWLVRISLPRVFEPMADKADKWDASRTKFPENLKPFLKAAMEAAYQHGLWNDRIEDGYNKAVCSTLPYNQLTLSVSLLLDS
jgi:hypothetical protein